ncbi:phage tail terminator-like protein [Pseudomonas sp. GL-RE-29]|uniref:phage tail terminator-like protein n=1 Tax=Pseudomonas sp. GL-RE-29 TaxID=2832375 RepID=UPI001CC11695|nr:phage tail terminator-like protein [Pseudomonas sp. GL-RE-29]
MSHRTIRQIYEARLAAWAAARTPALRIAYQGVPLTPNDGETYLAAFTLPAGTSSETLGGDHRAFTGLFQVSVVTPAGAGTGKAEGIVDELAALFPLNDRYAKAGLTVMTLTPLEPGPGVPEGNTWTIAASFQYRADTD